MKDTRREEGVRQTGETGRANAITEGVIWKQLLLFFFPILFGTFFQQLYNTADAVVVGRFVGKEALAAIGGSTSMLTNLLVGFFVGLSSGATVIIAQFYGAGRGQRVSEAVHTAIAFSLLCGILMTVGGLLFSDTALRLISWTMQAGICTFILSESRRTSYIIWVPESCGRSVIPKDRFISL